jgi:hypothetical protein
LYQQFGDATQVVRRIRYFWLDKNGAGLLPPMELLGAKFDGVGNLFTLYTDVEAVEKLLLAQR